MATPEDATAVAGIYLPYVRDAAVSFETSVPTAQEMRSRMTRTLATLPWLVVTDRQVVKGTPMPARTGRGMPIGGASMCRYTSTHPRTVGAWPPNLHGAAESACRTGLRQCLRGHHASQCRQRRLARSFRLHPRRRLSRRGLQAGKMVGCRLVASSAGRPARFPAPTEALGRARGPDRRLRARGMNRIEV